MPIKGGSTIILILFSHYTANTHQSTQSGAHLERESNNKKNIRRRAFISI